MSNKNTRPRVVVVGGSFSGLCAVRHLKNRADVTLIEPKDYFEYTPGVLHLLSGSNSNKALTGPISEVSRGSTHIRGLFEGIKTSTQTAIIKNLDGQGKLEVPYDILILCTGSPYIAPIRPGLNSLDYESRYNEINSFKNSLKNDEKVCILGGGRLVGVELAGEIAHRFKSDGIRKEIVLISRSELLGALPRKAGLYAFKWLKENNVEVIIGDECIDILTNKESLKRSIKTSKGRMINGLDNIIDCTNNKRSLLWNTKNTIHLNNPPASDEVVWPYNQRGFVEVNEYLQSTSNERIFAAGDVTELTSGVGMAATTSASGPYGTKSKISSVKNAHLAESQAEVVAENALKFYESFKNNSLSKANLLSYPSNPFYGAPNVPLLACVSLGPNNGIVVFNDLVLCGMVFSMIGGLIKFIIERSKVAEIKQKFWGRIFWAFGHVVVNTIHRALSIIHSIFTKPKRIDKTRLA